MSRKSVKKPRNKGPNAIFNLEQIVEDPTASVPNLILENCVFRNLYNIDDEDSFLSLIKPIGYSISDIRLESLVVEDYFLIEGLIMISDQDES